MKRNDTGDFCVLYAEPTDERESLFLAILDQKKPVVIMLADHLQVFQRPEDFSALKHLKRQVDVPIVFVIPGSERLTQLAGRYGFPVYLSMDALANALTAGHLTRRINRNTSPLDTAEHQFSLNPSGPLRQDTLLPTIDDFLFQKQDTPLLPLSPTSSDHTSSTNRYAQRRLPALIALFTTFLILATSVFSFLALSHKLPTNPAIAAAAAHAIVGHVTLFSSEQLSENSNQGIDDQVLIDLNGIPRPAPQKSYYAWLLSDHNLGDSKAIALGTLQVNKGHARLFYPGDQQHSNLLVITSRFLVTEEDSTMPPISPSPDYSTWRYYGEFSQTPIKSPDNTQHFSFLDHLRHLLASDPTLNELELAGGLNNWFYRNTEKTLEWTSSMREQWEESNDTGFLRRQTMRTLAYLDGSSFAWQDLPPNTPLLVSDRLARVGLLSVNGPNQDPPSYLAHIVRHLNGLLQANGSSDTLRKNVAEIVTALNDVEFWLTQVRHDAQKIMKMSDAQLRQPATLTLINDMITNVNQAYVGQTDPITGKERHGVIWIHDHMQFLATLDVSPFVRSNSSV